MNLTDGRHRKLFLRRLERFDGRRGRRRRGRCRLRNGCRNARNHLSHRLGGGFRLGGRRRWRRGVDDSHRGDLHRLGWLEGLGQRGQLFLQKLGGDLVEGARRDLGCGNAQFLRLVEHKLALKVQLLGDLVNANGHTAFYFTTDVPRTAPCATIWTIGDPDIETKPRTGSVGFGASTTGSASGQFTPNRFQN